MDVYPKITQDTLYDMAAFLVRDSDRIAAYAARVENMPKMHAKYLGVIEGHRDALAMVAGFLGYSTTDDLIAATRRLRSQITEQAATMTPHAAESDRLAASAGSVAHVLATDARTAWPVDHETGE